MLEDTSDFVWLVLRSLRVLAPWRVLATPPLLHALTPVWYGGAQVLVPMQDGKSEIHDLAAEDQMVLMGEMSKAALAVKVRPRRCGSLPHCTLHTQMPTAARFQLRVWRATSSGAKAEQDWILKSLQSGPTHLQPWG